MSREDTEQGKKRLIEKYEEALKAGLVAIYEIGSEPSDDDFFRMRERARLLIINYGAAAKGNESDGAFGKYTEAQKVYGEMAEISRKFHENTTLPKGETNSHHIVPFVFLRQHIPPSQSR